MRRLAPLVLLAGCGGGEAAREALPWEVAAEAPPTFRMEAPPVLEPVSLAELRGQEVLLFPDIAPEVATRRLAAHLGRCRTDLGARLVYDRSGMRIVGPAGGTRLSLTLAQVSRSSAVAASGPDFGAAVKEELADAVRGRSACAA